MKLWGFAQAHLLWGLLAVPLPFLLHLLGRWQAPVVWFAAFDFLQPSGKRWAWGWRLHPWLTLLLRTLVVRTLVVLLLVGSLARPHLAPSAAASALAGAPALAIVMDASTSMHYRRDGRSTWQRAQQQAQALLADVAPDSVVLGVVAAGGAASLVASAAPNAVALAAALAALPPPSDEASVAHADMGAALQLAAQQLARLAPTLPAQLLVLGDLAQHSFQTLPPLPNALQVHFMDVLGERQAANLALQRLEVESVPQLQAAAQAATHGTARPDGLRRLRVTLQNFGAAARHAVQLQLWVAQRLVQQRSLDCAAQQSCSSSFLYHFQVAEHHAVEVRVADDAAYAPDNRLALQLAVAAPLRLLALNGDKHWGGRDAPNDADALYFVEHALAALPAGDAPITMRQLQPEDFSAAQLQTTPGGAAAYDVVLLANVAQLQPAQVAALQAFVAQGGGLLISLGAQVAFETANASYGALLPSLLRDVQSADVGSAWGMQTRRWEHPIFAGLHSAADNSLASSLQASQTRRYFNVESGEAAHRQVLLQFDNGAPALLEARQPGGGSVMLLSISLALADSDLPLRSAFLVLLQRTIRYLAHAPQLGDASNAVTRDLRESDFRQVPAATLQRYTTAPSRAERTAAKPKDVTHLSLLCLSFLFIAECLLVARR